MKLIEIPFLGERLVQKYDVHVDYCISCHGVFLDIGELKKANILAEAIKKEKDAFGLFRLLERENASGVLNFFKHFF